MKRIVASVGLVALGASFVQAADAPSLSEPSAAKWWSVSANLRGFYDDNYNTVPENTPGKEDSFGYEIRPGASVNWIREQTSLKFDYRYSFIYYDKKPAGNSEKYDQVHQINAGLEHAFSERYQLRASDSFVVGQEADVLQSQGVSTAINRIPGDNFRNSASIALNAQMTRLFGLEFGYANSWFDYQATEDDTGGFPNNSASGTSDRLEHYGHVDARWQFLPQTIGLVGYQYSTVNYTGDEVIGIGGLMSDDRNYRAHYGYVGVEHNFRPNLAVSGRAGIRYNDFYNDPNSDSEVTPYLKGNLVWGYAPESSASIGMSYDLNPTDIVAATLDSFTQSQESFAIFGSIRHRIIPNLFGGVNGQIQHSMFSGGAVDGDTETYYLVGLSLQYHINHYLSAETGYDFTKVQSEINRGYDRNRVYIGLTASY